MTSFFAAHGVDIALGVRFGVSLIRGGRGLLVARRGLGLALVAQAAAAIATLSVAQADVFHLPHFVGPGDFALGVEPELVLTSGAGVGVNARYTHGISDLVNVAGMIGTGSGPRRFRAGADVAFDFFPDIEGQPGIGMAARALYVRVPLAGSTTDEVTGQLELTGIPYIHKAFATGKGKHEIDPFFSLPFGMSFQNGQYKALTSAVVGTLIKGGEHFWYSAEFGIAINHTDTYFAAGVTYYH